MVLGCPKKQNKTKRKERKKKKISMTAKKWQIKLKTIYLMISGCACLPKYVKMKNKDLCKIS